MFGIPETPEDPHFKILISKSQLQILHKALELSKYHVDFVDAHVKTEGVEPSEEAEEHRLLWGVTAPTEAMFTEPDQDHKHMTHGFCL